MTSLAARGKVITARGLSKLYSEGATQLRALADVDLDIYSGQLTLLLGPSGSGKTTLLSILGCILRATSGSLELLGEAVTSLPEKELASSPPNDWLCFSRVQSFPDANGHGKC